MLTECAAFIGFESFGKKHCAVRQGLCLGQEPGIVQVFLII